MYVILIAVFLFPFYYQAGAVHLYRPRCQPFSTTFPSSAVSYIHSSSSSLAPFVAVSPQGSYQTMQDGLELYMERPGGTIKTKDGVNDKTADGATINSTFFFLYVLRTL